MKYKLIFLVPLEKVQEIINFLDDEGMIYSTIDEEHFKKV